MAKQFALVFLLSSVRDHQYKTMRKHFVGLYLELCMGHSHKMVARAKLLHQYTEIYSS